MAPALQQLLPPSKRQPSEWRGSAAGVASVTAPGHQTMSSGDGSINDEKS